MASLCETQQCTIDRRGFRQELDSWRHKLIHCVGFENILDGLIGPELVEDLKLFKDFKHVASDWSFHENCLFCCLRRRKVKEHLLGVNKSRLKGNPKPLLVKDQIAISKLEKQTEDFLNAVFCRKDIPSFSDPHIPIVAAEILQIMISQFAGEYTSKTNSPQNSHPDSMPHPDQSLPGQPLLSGAPPPISPAALATETALNQNPVLSKLLMADQDAPLDLTIKKNPAESSEQDGVLDLSIKKKHHSSSRPVHSPCLSPALSALKSESQDFQVTKDLQSTSTLKKFMAKLCLHHQRQIVDAIGFLQMEVKAHSSTNAQKASNKTSGSHGTASSTVMSEKSCPEVTLPDESTPKADVHSVPSSYATNKIPEKALSIKTSLTASPVSGSNQPLGTPVTNSTDGEQSSSSDHAPLKMKIMTKNAAGKKVSCVLNASLSSQSDATEESKCSLNSSSRAETQSARLSSSVRRHNQTSLTHQAKHREDLGHAKKTQANLISVHMTIPSDSARTARKTIRTSSEHQSRDCRAVVDPDLGHCDIVFIDKPITECFKEKRRGLLPRRNARKSTRGHMYSDEIWELKTVRTLAGRGNCPNPMPELITLVTPKQMLSKPEGVPHVNMLFAGTCRETLDQQTLSAGSNESVLPEPGDGVVATNSKVDNIVVEPSQTDQCHTKVPSGPSSPVKSPVENKVTDLITDVEQEATVDSDTVAESNCVGQHPTEMAKEKLVEPRKIIDQISEQTAEMGMELLEKVTTDATESPKPTVEQVNTESILQQNSDPSAEIQVEETTEKDEGENMEDCQSQKIEPEAQVQQDNSEEAEKVPVPNAVQQELKEMKTPEKVAGDLPLESKDNVEDYDVSAKTLDSLLKELPPWRRKRTSKNQQLTQSESGIVGYVNGRPVSSSDRSLRHRAGSNPTSPSKTPVKSGQNVSNNSLANSKLESDVDKKKQEKGSPESSVLVNSLKGASTTEQVTDSSSDTSSTKASAPLLRSKQILRQKTIQRENNILPVLPDQSTDLGQSTESKRQLRSSSQKQSGTSAPQTNSSVVLTIPPPKLSTLILPPADQLPSLLLPDSLPVITPLSCSSEPPISEDSQQNTVSECPKTDVSAQPIEVNSEEVQQKEQEKGCETNKQKLRSAKVVEEYRKEEEEEKKQLDGHKPNSLENQSSVKTEVQMQSMPLRSRRSLQKDSEGNDTLIQKKNPDIIEDRSVSGEDSSSSTSNRPRRMPLRSETIKPEMSPQCVSQSQPANSKKSSLRSQRSLAPPTSATDTARQSNLPSPVKTNKSQIKSHSASVASMPHRLPFVIAPKHEPPKQMPNKFFEVLTGEDGQQLVSNLNLKYDKMQKGWVQLDKEGQPAVKYKNKADRQAAIWRSKRRTRKPKSLEQQKFSPVQMLFMKGFNLSSICRWFLETTETKSLVIVKKVNTRLPSETQLCFHSSSGVSGTSQGVFPSIQAERLKKHLKKFAIASPVKSNAKSKKLIAKAFEQVVNAVKGKERAEPFSNTEKLEKPCTSTKARAQIPDSQKSSGKSKNPASARILRKYSNIREKMQVQQSSIRLKEASKMLQSKKMKPLAATKSAAKANVKPSLKGKKLVGPGIKQVKESKLEKRKTLAKNQSSKPSLQEKAVKAQGSCKVTRDATKKELPKRVSQRLGLSKEPEPSPVNTSRNKVISKKSEADKAEAEKCSPNKVNSVKIQAKECPQSAAEVKGMTNGDSTSQQNTDVKAQASPDQVLTRSQKKMEAAAPLSPSVSSKKATKSTVLKTTPPKAIKKADESTLTRSGASTRSQAALLLPSATKVGTKRPQEPLVNPTKRTRTK